MTTHEQDPSEKLMYQQEIDTGDTISSVTWSITPAGPIIGTPTNTSTVSTVRVHGLTLGKVYTLSVVIIGASTQEFIRSCYLRCVRAG